MTQNYIGINGLVTQSLADIRADLVTKFQSVYGNDINVEQNSPDGQWLNILAQEKKDILDLVTQYYNNLDVDRVIGIPQQILYKLNGLIIKAYTYSFVFVEVTITAQTTLQGLDANLDSAEGVGYTVRDTNGNRWILANTINLAPGTYTLNFRAADLGGVQAQANTIKVMETIQAGVARVNNPSVNYITGATGETPAEFRLRRNRSVEAPSQGFKESIEAQILQLDNVTDCKVYDNKTDQTVNEIPPHAVWVIVEGGNAQEFGKVIYNNLPPGIPMYGNTTVEITESDGDVVTVEYGTPQAVLLYIRATIQNFNNSPLDEVYIKQQMESTLQFGIGEMVETATITSAIKTIIGGLGTPYNVEVSSDNSTWVEFISPANLDEYFSVSSANITLTVTGGQ